MGYDDVFATSESLARRRKLLDAMQTQSLATPITGNSPLASIVQALAKIGTAHAASKRSQALDQEGAANQKAYSNVLGGELNKYLQARNGAPGQTMTDAQASDLMQNDVAPTLADPVQANPRAAVTSAIASRFPEMQKIGMTDLTALDKDKGLTAKDLLGVAGASVPSRVAAAQGLDPGLLQPENKPMTTAGGVIFDPSNPGKPLADYRDTYNTPSVLSPGSGLPPILAQSNSRGKVEAIDKAPKVTVGAPSLAVSVGKGETALMEGIGKDTAKRLGEARESATTAYSTLNSVRQMQELDKKGVFSGPGANMATTLAGVATSLGIPVDKERLANSETFQQQFAGQIGKYLANSSLGRTLTDTDRQLLERTMPNLLQSPSGRAKIYGLLTNEANKAIDRHKSFANQLKSALPSEYHGLLNLNPIDSNPTPGVLPNVLEPVPGDQSGKPGDWKVVR